MESPLIWAEIDLDAISHNVRELRRLTGPKARFMAVVKADGYGHGAVRISRRALDSGADALGVARLEEAVRLRKAGIKAEILIFGHTPAVMAETLMALDLTQTVCSLDAARMLSSAAGAGGKKITVHLKVDTGMGRLGLLPDHRRPDAPECTDSRKALTEIVAISRLSGLELRGIFTHFAAADAADKSSARNQFDMFRQLLDALEKEGVPLAVRHAANSAAIIELPETHLDMVRAGISLYGLYPSDAVDKSRILLKPVMSLKSRIVHLKKVPAGFPVSYGHTYTTAAPTTIATIPVGYADGLNRLLSSRGRMLVGGRSAPITGRVCMDLTMLDVGRIPDAALGDEVVVFGRQGNAAISVDEIAATVDTINYEVVTGISNRVPRVYVQDTGSGAGVREP